MPVTRRRKQIRELVSLAVLVMGDNRGNSHDGRMFGFVHVDAVLGRTLGVFLSDDGLTWRPL